MKVYYPAAPASDGTSMTPPENAPFTVHELSDTTFSNPLPLETLAGTNAAPLTTTAQGVLPDVYVISDNYSHAFKSGEWVFRRDSFDGAYKFAQEARQDTRDARDAAFRAAAPTPEDIAAGISDMAERYDYVQGSDTRVLQYIPDNQFAIPFADRDGYVAGGFTQDGQLRLLKPIDLPKNGIATDAVSGLTTLDPSTGYVAGILDKDGYMSLGVRSDGSVKVFKGDGGVASRNKIVCFGDSLTRGYTGSVAWDIADSWPSKLAEKLPGVEVVNSGFGGNTADEIRLRVNAKDLWLMPVGGSIPASGSVEVTTRQKPGFVPDGTFSTGAYLAGIAGNFTRTSTSMIFTRTSPGTAVSVPAPVKLVVPRADYSGHTAIIWLGRNDVSYGALGAESTVAEHVVASTMELVEWLTPRVKQVIVVGTTNRVDEPRGTAKYNTVIEINERLAQLLPGRYMNVRTWLVNRAVYDAGMTPTQADLDAIAKDTPPPQIMDGGSHYNKPIAPLLADMFYTRLTEKGFI